MHDKSESLWAAFALSFLEQISKNRDWKDPIYNAFSNLCLLKSRFDFSKNWLALLQNFFASISIFGLAITIPYVYWLQGGKKELENFSQSILCQLEDNCKKASDEGSSNEEPNAQGQNAFLKILLVYVLGGGGTSSATLILLAKLRDLVGDSKLDLTKYLKNPNYEEQIAFIEKFHEDFKKIVDAYVGKDEKVYVFIDDIDRCELGKSADLLQALNLMISNDPNLIFILGMDREKVAAAITFKQKDVLPYLASISGENQDKETEIDTSTKELDYGFSFMEKFVQLSFSVPKSSERKLLDHFQVIFPGENDNTEKLYFWTRSTFFLTRFCSKLAHDSRSTLTRVQNALIKTNANTRSALSNLYSVIPSAFRALLSPICATTPKLQKSPSTGLDQRSEDESPSQKGDDEENSTRHSEKGLDIFPILEKDLTADSAALAELIKMVAPFFDNNPRRLNQYINVLKLRTYIAYYAIGVPFAERGTITIEQMGKYIAITLKYPRLLFELGNNNNLLFELEECAFAKSTQKRSPESTSNNQEKENANYWVNNYPKLEKLLCYQMAKPQYSLKNEKIKKLLQVSPQGIPSKYFQLREFLTQKKWREADQETAQIMLAVANIRKPYLTRQGHLTPEDLRQFPCEDLRILDQLWVDYSEGKFGFSIQKDVYLKNGGKADGEYYEEVFEKFCDVVRWRDEGHWLSNSELTFDTSAPKGHLSRPSVAVVLGGVVFFVVPSGSLGIGWLMVSLLSHRAL